MHPYDTPCPDEQWRPVVGYEGVYSVSSCGRVRRDGLVKGARPGHILLPHFDTRFGKPRARVSLWHLNRGKTQVIAHLVAAAFLGPRPDDQDVNHCGGDPSDDHARNLEYCTHKANGEHAAALGLMAKGERHWTRQHPERLNYGDENPSRQHPERMRRGEAVNFARLTEMDVRIIRASVAAGVPRRYLADRLGIYRQTVDAIVRGKTWKHVEEGETHATYPSLKVRLAHDQTRSGAE